MNLLTKDELKALSQIHNGPHVSIFMPTEPVGQATRQNPVRLKNLLAEAEAGLIELGLAAPQARRLLSPARELIDDFNFWQHQSQALALLISSELFQTYRFPLQVDELVVISERFHLKPLLPHLSSDGHFFLLALSQNEVRLYGGSQYTLEEVSLTDIPRSLAEALWYEEPHKQQQFHTATAAPSAPGGRPAVFHGHGVGSDDQKDTILRFFQQIDQGLAELLQDESAPLVLAGVEFLLPLYQQANSYQNLLDQGITGNPEHMSPAELHHQAWSIVRPVFERNRQEAAARYHDLSNTDQASQDLRTIILAAYYGRVETLFVAVGQQQWGRFEPDTNTITLHGEAKPGAEDLLDAAAVQSLLNGGTVFALKPAQMPVDSPLAAIFRYASLGRETR